MTDIEHIDASGPAPHRRTREGAFRAPQRPLTAAQRDRITPPVDWTGIQFKAPADCERPDYNHRGRLSGQVHMGDVA